MDSYLTEIALKGALALSLSFGHQLGLFDALAAIGSAEEPATASQLSEKAGIDIEFALMWLNGMVTGKIIESNEDGTKFWIAAKNLDSLTGDIPAAGLAYCRLVPLISSRYNEAIEIAKEKISDEKKLEEKEQGHTHGHKHGHQQKEDNVHVHNHSHEHGHEHSHDNHAEAFPLMELLSKTMYKKHLIPDFLPLMGIREKLENGGMEVLDVGCGSGFHICELAQEFPQCNFTGIDISSSTIKRAEEVAKERDLANVKFEEISGEEMPQEWTNKYDWVFSWNSIHDHKHPKIAIKEINRVLKDCGRYTMIEINKPENLKDSGTSPISKFWATAGVFKITRIRRDPEVVNWTNTAANEMLREAGFKSVEPVKLPFFDFNILFVAQKHLVSGKHDL